MGTELLHERLGDVRVNVEPVGCRARPSATAELGGHCSGDGRAYVGILGHDEGRISSELHRGVDNPVGGLMEQEPANPGRPGEGELPDSIVGQPLRDDPGGVGPGVDVDDPVWHPRLGQKIPDRQRGQRCLRGGLQDDSAPGREGGGDLARRHRRGEVPRCDQCRHARRAVGHQRPRPASGGLAVLPAGTDRLLGEPAEELRRIHDLGCGVIQRLAVLPRDEPGEPVLVAEHQLEGTAQQVRAVARRGPRPRRKPLRGSRHRSTGLRRPQIGDGAHVLERRRIHDSVGGRCRGHRSLLLGRVGQALQRKAASRTSSASWRSVSLMLSGGRNRSTFP